MGKNIFKEIESEKKVPEETKAEIISNIRAVEKGKEIPKLFNTGLYGALVNFFKLRQR